MQAMRCVIVFQTMLLIWKIFLISIVTGIISSLIITFIYRRIDDKRAQITFLSELYVFSEKANVLLYNYLLSLKRESVIDEVMELLNTKPVWFKWVKFGQKEDQRIVRTVYEESVQLLVDIAEIEKCEKFSRSSSFVETDRKEFIRKSEALEKGLGDRIKAFDKNKKELKKMYKEYTEPYRKVKENDR